VLGRQPRGLPGAPEVGVTTNTVSNRKFDVSQVIRMALRASSVLSSYQEPDEAMIGEARDLLDALLDNLAVEGVTSKTVEFQTVAIVADTSSYQLSESTLEVLEPVWFAAAGQGEPPTTQTELQLVGSQKWRELETDRTGSPMYLFADRGADGILARLWPIPDDSGTLRLRVQRMLMDSGPGTHTVELERYWVQYLIQALAAEIAQTKGLADVAQLCLVRAETMKTKCLNQDSPHVDGQITWSHRTAWSAR
jgi:hypothetical protein